MSVSGNQDTFGKILNSTYQISDSLGYSLKELENKSINVLMPEYIRSKHDTILEEYFTKNKIYTGASDILNIHPVNSKGYLKLGKSRVKLFPDIQEGIVLFAVSYLIDVTTLIEDYDLDEELHHITFVANTGEVLGVSEGMHEHFGLDPKFFSDLR